MSQSPLIPSEAPSFEALYTRLQQIVARLESGDLPLEEALTLYEEGVQVSAHCQQLLDTATLRVQTLEIERTPFEIED